jgi:Flp pilus assembly protein protease CpaA
VLPVFFPNLPFAWLVYLSLVGLCWLTAIVDWNRLRIPNQLTLTILGVAWAMNLIRGAWLGVEGEPGRYFGWTGLVGGLVEGFCFSAAGFAVGLAIFFVMWQLGTCGGGDVKLMAAIGAWIGPIWFLYVLLGTYIAVVTIMLIWWMMAFLKIVPARRAISYAPPALFSVVLVMLWVWRHDLLTTAF